MRRVIVAVALLLPTGCTYTASARRLDDLPDEERVVRVVDVLTEDVAGPPTVQVDPGPVPDALVLTLRAPLEVRCRVHVARRARQALREAEATYVPRRSLLKHGLAFSVGAAVFAPVWLPLYYCGLAADEAEATLERGSGGTTYDDAGGCYVTRVERAELPADWVDTGEVVERDLRREGPLRGVRVRVRSARGGVAAAWRGRADSAGRVVVPLRALHRAGGLPTGALELTIGGETVTVAVPREARAPDDDGPIDVDALVAADGPEAVVQRLARNIAAGALAPDSPVPRALPALLRRRGAPLALTEAARPHIEAAALALRALDHAVARRRAASALEVQPACWEAHRLLGLAARLAGDETTATRHLRVAWSLLPETSPLSDRVLAELVTP